jgi:hypothetical protein
VLIVLLPAERSYINDKNCVRGEEAGMESKIEVVSTVKVQNSPDLYKIVDALNRTLKRDDLMFGLALDQDDQEKAIFTIYRT